jgi:hypothetical protein
MWTVDGISAKSADRSECGVETCYRVGSGLFAGWIAKFSAFSTTALMWGAGRARGVLTSSISTSVDCVSRARVVFLVDTIIIHKYQYGKNKKVQDDFRG